MESEKIGIDNFIYKTETETQDVANKHVDTKGEREGGIYICMCLENVTFLGNEMWLG